MKSYHFNMLALSMERLFCLLATLYFCASSSLNIEALYREDVSLDSRMTSSWSKSRSLKGRSYEFCLMANPNGNICRMEVEFSKDIGKKDVIQVKELDGRLFRISDISQTWREYVTVSKSKPQITFQNETYKDIKTCKKILRRHDNDISGTILYPVKGFECTEFAVALMRRMLDKDAFPGSGNGSSLSLPFDEYDDDDYGYRDDGREDEHDVDADVDADVDVDDGEQNDKPIPISQCHEVVSQSKDNTHENHTCQLSIESSGILYHFEVKEIEKLAVQSFEDVQEFHVFVNISKSFEIALQVTVNKSGTITFKEDPTNGYKTTIVTCDAFMNRTSALNLQDLAIGNVEARSTNSDRKVGCTPFGSSLLYFIAQRTTAMGKTYYEDEDEDNEDENETQLEDYGSERCSMATPNGNLCQMMSTHSKNDDEDDTTLFQMEELDNREFLISSFPPGMSLADHQQDENIYVKVHKNGTIDIVHHNDHPMSNLETDSTLTCTALLQNYKEQYNIPPFLILESVEEFPCTAFAQSMFRYLFGQEANDVVSPRAPETTAPSSAASSIPTLTTHTSATSSPSASLSPSTSPVDKDPTSYYPTLIVTTQTPFTNSPSSQDQVTEIGSGLTPLPTKISATSFPTSGEPSLNTEPKTTSPTSTPLKSPTAEQILTPTMFPSYSFTTSSPSSNLRTQSPTIAESTVKDAITKEDGNTISPVGSPSAFSGPVNSKTFSPTTVPSTSPTTNLPTFVHTDNPTSDLPTFDPTASIRETLTPTLEPTILSTTNDPSLLPTLVPTLRPTTEEPSVLPTLAPTLLPTTEEPSFRPSSIPTTLNPSRTPTLPPTTSGAPTTAKPTLPGTRCSNAAIDGTSDCELSVAIFGFPITVSMRKLKQGNVFEMKAQADSMLGNIGFGGPWVAYAEVNQEDGTVAVEGTDFLQSQTFECNDLLDDYSRGNVPYVPFVPSNTNSTTCSTFATALLSIMIGEGIQMYLMNRMN